MIITTLVLETLKLWGHPAKFFTFSAMDLFLSAKSSKFIIYVLRHSMSHVCQNSKQIWVWSDCIVLSFGGLLFLFQTLNW